MLLFVLVFVFAGTQAQDGPSVNTSQGMVIGSVGNGGIMSFYGLHYAGSTSGVNRFKAPTPAPTYPGPYHAVDNNVMCAQQSTRGLIGVEDCLVLNVHTKNLTASNPVMVWIDGENYETTSSTPYSSENLVKENIVFVSINYRLSIFGFLCLGVPEAPGNAGLKDIVQGLKWIQENIAGFGGNPNNVVLLGHGSGAAMVDIITLSPMANGLVHKAIVLSGSALSPWAVAYDSLNYAEAVGSKLGYSEKSHKELAELLTSTDINVLSNALTDFKFFNNTALFAPCIENVNLNPNGTLLSDAPINILRSGNYSHIPYIAGYTNREGTLRAEQAAFHGWLNKMQSNFTDFLQADLKFESLSNKTAVAQTVREFYFGQRAINIETINDYLDYFGDTLILVPVIRGARERALTSTAGVRLFEFAFRREYDPDWAYPQIPLNGVRHGGILPYIFDSNLSEFNKSNNSITRRLIYFSRTGTQGGHPDFVMWEPISNSIIHMLYIHGEEVSNNFTVYGENAQVNLNKERTNFWNAIYNTHYRAPTTVSSGDSLFSFGLLIFFSVLFVTYL